jgi:hypothetical protein
MRPALLVLALLAVGCRQEPAPPPPPPSEAATAEAPGTRADTLWIEGMAEPVTLQRYATPEGFPLAFETYLPPEWTSETVASGEGEAVRFSPSGPIAGEALMSVIVLPEGTDREAALRRAEDHALSEIRADPEASAVAGPPAEPWPLAEVVLMSEAVAGRVDLGEHAGRYFLVSTRYPLEAGDGMGPRVAKILETWRWLDTGEPLYRGPSINAQP